MPTGIAGAGLTFTKVAEYYDQATTGGGVSLWRALSASPSSGAITITCANNQGNYQWSVEEYANVDTSGTNGSGAIVQTAMNQSFTGAATSITATLGAFGSAANGATALHAWFNLGGSIPTATPDTGWTELSDAGRDGVVACAVESSGLSPMCRMLSAGFTGNSPSTSWPSMSPMIVTTP